MKIVLISIIIIIVLTLILAIGVAYLAKLAKKKNIKVDSILEDTTAALNTAETVAAAIAPLFPQYAPLLKTILYFVTKFVNYAENLSKTAQTGTVIDRKVIAMQGITATLKQLNIPVDTDMSKFIDSAVEMAVRALPKTTPAVEVAEVVTTPTVDTAATAAA